MDVLYGYLDEFLNKVFLKNLKVILIRNYIFNFEYKLE